VIFEEEWMDDLDNVEQRLEQLQDRAHQLIDVLGVVDTRLFDDKLWCFYSLSQQGAHITLKYMTECTRSPGLGLLARVARSIRSANCTVGVCGFLAFSERLADDEFFSGGPPPESLFHATIGFEHAFHSFSGQSF
jgi:hypothetical protein